MKKFTKIATAIVAGCALVGVTTGGAILLNDDDKDIIINVDTIPQEEPQEPEIPAEGEDIPQDTPVEETPTEGETEDEIPTEGESEESEEKTSPKETPSEEEPEDMPTSDFGYITVEVRMYRHEVYSRSDILNFEGKGSISVYNLYEKIKAEYPSRKEFSSPSKSFNTYLKYSDDSTVDLIVHFK